MAPEFIPERPKDAFRTLIVLLDGTGDQDDKDATNIVLLDKMLYNGKKYPANDNKQLVHYSTGIGADTTQSYSDLVRYAYDKVKTVSDQAVANSFADHLIGGPQLLGLVLLIHSFLSCVYLVGRALSRR
ncbi:hypothetical protein B0H19DRAFT_174235 [Mycena capillaripes]|nr:hypothetical protein B0H19DRAFT_174235 [Mycena capillaripes]